MSLDWIKVECTLPDKPEVHAIAQACKLSPDEALGKLVRLFVWYTQHFTDGREALVTKKTVDKVVSKWGFADAMQACGWLFDDPDAPQHGATLRIVNFDRHNSKSAKSRALALRRMSEMRGKRYADVTQGASLPSISISNSTALPVDEPDKPNQDKGSAKVKAPLDLPAWLPVDAWNAYLAMRVKIRKPATPEAVELAIRRLDEMRLAGHDVRAVLEQSIFNSWQGLFEPKGGPRTLPAAQGFQNRDYQSGATDVEQIKWLDGNERNPKS